MDVVTREIILVPVSSISPGGTFQYAGEYYVSTCFSVRRKDIWGINLENGNYMSVGITQVALVQMEARVL